jgi:D-xylulose reductase
VDSAGPVGLLTAAVAKALGSKRVLIIDIIQDKLDFAKNYTATDIWLSTLPRKGEDIPDYARRQSIEIRDSIGFDLGNGPNAFDLVIDCTGAEPCVATGILLTADGGTYVQTGIRAMNAQVP